MRLTLRTLLAYLDDILDPADARELGQKIEESEFASGLVHRIRSVTRKLRLGAPKLAGKGMGLDANTVAEYLDNTLPQDRVPDFEKVCLESDVQLAEVAACHQILTLVLGEPADVDPALRERIRSLRTDLGPTDREETAERVGTSRREPEREPVPAVLPLDRRATRWAGEPESPHIEEAAVSRTELSGSSVRLVPVLATLVVTFLLALAALVALGPLDHDHPLLGRFFADTSRIAQQQDAQRENSSPAPDAQERTGANDVAPAEPSQPPAAGSDLPPPAAGDTEKLPAAESTTGSLPPPTLPEIPPEKVSAPEAEPSTATEAAEPTAMDDPRLDRAKLAPADKPAEDAAPAEPLALYTSDQHVLARFDAATDTWPRLATNDPLAADTRLVALPTYRPQILLSSGVQVVLIGPAELQLVGADADGVPGVVLQYGRFVATSDGKPDSRLNIQIGARRSRATFQDVDATLVLEVRHYLPVGVDPTSRPANWVCDVFASAGLVTWQDEAAASAIPLSSTQRVTLVDTSELVMQPLPQSPDWLDARNTAPIIQSASQQLEPLLELNRSVTISLQEQVANRLVEVRTLAICSLGSFGEFDPFVSALSARELRYFWKDIVESLRSAAVHSPETATQVRTTFERLRGNEGQQLYRMLWGFSPEQLAGGDAKTLVDALSSLAIDMRVLAYLNLNAITGKTNLFQPDREPKTQRRAILSWDRDLQQGEIVYKVPPIEPPGLQPPLKEDGKESGASNVP